MPDTRWTLIGKMVVAIVHATDNDLRKGLKAFGWKNVQTKLYSDNTPRKKNTNGRRKNYGKIKLKRKDKPTAKQLRARKLFAMRAKRGDFRR